VLTDTTPDVKVVREEIFGPVVVAMPFGSEEDVVHSGNETSIGLASGVWTRDINKAHRTAHRLHAGTVWINCYVMFDAGMPFGGYKEPRWAGRWATTRSTTTSKRSPWSPSSRRADLQAWDRRGARVPNPSSNTWTTV
jgi:acyl-CoA reductase-like NAD-dependent aldehyde dehydrogenase